MYSRVFFGLLNPITKSLSGLLNKTSIDTVRKHILNLLAPSTVLIPNIFTYRAGPGQTRGPQEHKQIRTLKVK